MTALDPGQLWVFRIRALAVAAILTVALLVAEALWLPDLPVVRGTIGAAAGIALFLWAMLMARRRYRSWAYRLDEEELHVQHGIWTHIRTVVPFGRVQHIDVAQGPLERRFGVGTLILHTAGTRNSAVALPGLAYEEAGRMRDVIRAMIRSDLI